MRTKAGVQHFVEIREVFANRFLPVVPGCPKSLRVAPSCYDYFIASPESMTAATKANSVYFTVGQRDSSQLTVEKLLGHFTVG
jgi:hypothetical protein